MHENNKKLEDIHVVFSSDILLQTDQDNFMKISAFFERKIHLHVGMNELKLTKNDLLILDEADYILLD